VLFRSHRVKDQIPIRRLRILKYRGSAHGTNEYPFLIDEDGISLQPVTSLSLTHKVSNERLSSGISGLDAMMEGKGYFRGSSILLTGTAGTGKSSFACHFIASACSAGERCLYFAFEESQEQIVRNMRTIGIDLNPFLKNGLLSIQAERPSIFGLEMHLVTMIKRIQQFKPTVLVVDPVTNFIIAGNSADVTSMLTRLLDLAKMKGITMLFTSLTSAGVAIEDSMTGISSLMDTWILLRSQDIGGMRDHGVYIVKSRGMAHSNGVRQFRFTNKGLVLQ